MRNLALLKLILRPQLHLFAADEIEGGLITFVDVSLRTSPAR